TATVFFFSSRRRHTRFSRDWSSDVCSSDLEKLGPVDILVNNAGVQHVSPVEDFPVAKWDLIIALNLSSAFHTTRLAFPDMKARRSEERRVGKECRSRMRLGDLQKEHGITAS